MIISSGLTTEIDTADEGVTQLTNFRIESGIVNCPLSLIILTALIFSDYKQSFSSNKQSFSSNSQKSENCQDRIVL